MKQLLAINQMRQVKKSVAVEQICTFRDDLLEEIGRGLKTPGKDHHVELRRDTLKRANKEQLCLWVETLVLAFSATAMPLLHDTLEDAACVESMRNSKLRDQSTIIELQQKLIDAKDIQVKELQETVRSEMKSVQSEVKTFSSVLQKEIKTQSSDVQKSVTDVQKSFDSAISVKRVGEAVKQMVDRDERGRNVIIFGVSEDTKQPLETRVGEVLQQIGQKPRIIDCCRLGQEKEGAVRPVKITLSSSDVVTELLRNSKLLKDAEGCRQIFICPDRTVEQRKVQKGLIDQMKKLRTEHPGARYCIRNGKVVPCDNSLP